MEPMLVLALDTAMSACSAALVEGAGLVDERVLAVRATPMERGHAEALLPLIEQIMRDGGRTYADLDLIAATVGPGAFTGIRVGLAAARGLALAADKPCAGVTTLEAIAAAALSVPVLVCVESRRADLFAQAFGPNMTGDGRALSSPASLPLEGLAACSRAAGLAPGFGLAGDGAVRAAAALAEAGIAATLANAAMVPDPVLVARIAAGRHGTADALVPRPLYLRPPDVTYPKTV